MLAADTLASYGTLAMFKNVQRIKKTGSYTLAPRPRLCPVENEPPQLATTSKKS